MTEILRQKLLKLVRGDDGVALVVTLALFMFLYVSCAGVYTVGRAVKDRIILQNAVDAAAYSAAVVQADYLSRIATINKAMAWNYAQFVKSQKKWIALYFLKSIYLKGEDYLRNSNEPLDKFNDPITVDVGSHSVDIGKNGKNNTGWGDRDRDGYELDLDHCKKSARFYWERIEEQNDALSKLNSEMKDVIKSQVFDVLMANLPFRLGEYCRVHVKRPVELLAMGSKHEDDFIVMSDDSEKDGINQSKWFISGTYEKGLGRVFEGALKTTDWYVKLPISGRYIPEQTGGVDVDDIKSKLASDEMLLYYGSEYLAEPLMLPTDYFPCQSGIEDPAFHSSDGAITVAVAKWNENPWKQLVRDLTGIHAAFDYGEKNVWTFAIASAQAGYRSGGVEETGRREAREYSLDETNFDFVTFGKKGEDEESDEFEGCDWDALYIPVRMAFSKSGFNDWMKEDSSWELLVPESERKYLSEPLEEIRFHDLNHKALARMHNNAGIKDIMKWDTEEMKDFLDLMYH